MRVENTDSPSKFLKLPNQTFKLSMVNISYTIKMFE